MFHVHDLIYCHSRNKILNPPAGLTAGNPSSIPGLGRSPGGGHGNPLQSSCLENPVDRGVWRATVRGGHERVGRNLATKQQPQSHHLLSVSTTTTITPGPYPYPSYMLGKGASGMQFLNSDSATGEEDLGLDHFLACMHAKSFQSCSTLCDPMDCSSPGSCVHGILQARIPEWVVISFSRGSSQPRDRTWVSCVERQVLSHRATRETPQNHHVVLRVKHPASTMAHHPHHTAQMRMRSRVGGQTELTLKTD